jgi:hypothetical protein
MFGQHRGDERRNIKAQRNDFGRGHLHSDSHGALGDMFKPKLLWGVRADANLAGGELTKIRMSDSPRNCRSPTGIGVNGGSASMVRSFSTLLPFLAALCTADAALAGAITPAPAAGLGVGAVLLIGVGYRMLRNRIDGQG